MSRVPALTLSLDLGQLGDHAAATLIRRLDLDAGYEVPALKQWPRGTPYPELVRTVCGWLARPEMVGCTLVVEQNGVGAPVVDLFLEAKVRRLVRIVITGGHGVSRGKDGSWHVPKKDLVGSLQNVLGHRRLKIAQALPEAATLKKELEVFQMRVSKAGNETFAAAGREHDDVAMSLMNGIWTAERATPWRHARVH